MSNQPPTPKEDKPATLNELEIIALDGLCKKLSAGENLSFVTSEHLVSQHGIPSNMAWAVFIRLRSIGALEERTTGGMFGQGGQTTFYSVSGRICDIAAAQRAFYATKVDFVDAAYRWARSHKCPAIFIILVLSLATLAALVNHSIQIYKHLSSGVPTPPSVTLDQR